MTHAFDDFGVEPGAEGEAGLDVEIVGGHWGGLLRTTSRQPLHSHAQINRAIRVGDVVVRGEKRSREGERGLPEAGGQRIRRRSQLCALPKNDWRVQQCKAERLVAT